VIEGTSDAVNVKDRHGRYLMLNEAAIGVLGKSTEEVLGEDDTFLFPPDEATAIMDGDRLVLEGGKASTYEEVATNASGEQRHYLSTKGPIFDAGGEVIGLFGIARDITERVEAEGALRATEAMFRALVENSFEFIVQVDAQGKPLYVSPSVERVLGWTPQEHMTLSPFDLVHPDDLEASSSILNRVVAGEALTTLTVRARAKDGMYRWIESVAQNMLDVPGVQAIVTHNRDVTERKHAEERLRQYAGRVVRAQEEERQRVARELHDSLGQSLTSIALYARSLEETVGGEERERLSKLAGTAEKAVIETRRLVWSLRPPELDELGLVPALERLASDVEEAKGVRVEVHDGLRGFRLPTEVRSTAYRVVQEALTNVVKHADAETASVIVGRRNGNFSAIIEDDGSGFDTRQTGEGPHFGIIGMRERADLIGGSLDIESVPGKGTTVRLEVPLPS